MALYVNGKVVSGGGGNAGYQELTYDEYMALTPEQKTDGTMYFLTDVNGDGSQFQPVIYSETEREIGVWTDGKPLYQKTFYYNITSTTGDWTVFDDNVSYDVLVSAQGTVSLIQNEQQVIHSSPASDPRFEVKSDHKLYYFGSATRSGYATFKYTKTTDTAGSGTWTPQGVPAVHYSTTEQVIGTWYDGSTLYEKTIKFNNKTATQYDSTCQLTHGVTDIGTVKFVVSAYYDFDGGENWANGLNNILSYPLGWKVGSNTIYLTSSQGGLEFTASSSRSYLFTIRYTKSSS